MGTLIILYQHPEASRLVSELNERNRRWWASDAQGYRDMGKVLDIQQDTKMPRGVEEIDFQSKKYPDFFPTRTKVQHLGAFLESHGLMPLNAVFGYPSWEPEDWYGIPDWEKALASIRSVILSFPAATKEMVEEIAYRKHLEAFEEMILWVIARKDRDSYFLLWSA